FFTLRKGRSWRWSSCPTRLTGPRPWWPRRSGSRNERLHVLSASEVPVEAPVLSHHGRFVRHYHELRRRTDARADELSQSGASMSAKNDTRKSAKSAAATHKKFKGFTPEERAAMKEYVQEQRESERRGPRVDKADEESVVLAKIAEMREPDRAMGKRLHAIIKASAPALSP